MLLRGSWRILEIFSFLLPTSTSLLPPLLAGIFEGGPSHEVPVLPTWVSSNYYQQLQNIQTTPSPEVPR